MSISQEVLDYSNDAQYRVAADTRILKKRTTISVVAGTQEYPLPDDVIDILGVWNENLYIQPLMLDDALTLLSANGAFSTLDNETQMQYIIEPDTIGFLPVPTVSFVATLYYIARPAALTSAADFELQGAAEALIDHYVLADKLSDDRQPELALSELVYCQAEAARVARKRVGEQPQRIPALGYSPQVRS